MAKKHVLGLHTKEERQNAYRKVKAVYDEAVRSGGPLRYAYGIGYIEAVLQLGKEEAEDSEFMRVLGELLDDLDSRYHEAVYIE
jgi:hypothetical protein